MHCFDLCYLIIGFEQELFINNCLMIVNLFKYSPQYLDLPSAYKDLTYPFNYFSHSCLLKVRFSISSEPVINIKSSILILILPAKSMHAL